MYTHTWLWGNSVWSFTMVVVRTVISMFFGISSILSPFFETCLLSLTTDTYLMRKAGFSKTEFFNLHRSMFRWDLFSFERIWIQWPSFETVLGFRFEFAQSEWFLDIWVYLNVLRAQTRFLTEIRAEMRIWDSVTCFVTAHNISIFHWEKIFHF